MSLLLLQARLTTDPALAEERASFAQVCGLPLAEISTRNLVTDGPPTLQQASEFNALLMGGSGDFLVSARDMPHIGETLAFLSRVVDSSLPMFASCFGFQCLVEALGGRIVYDPDNAEVGTFDVTLTSDGADDQLLGRMPGTFTAQLGRKDRASRLPEGVVNLARSEACPSQALRIPEKPIWATQFHPELTVEANRGRFYNYLENYQSVMAPGALRDIAESFRPSPHTPTLLEGFVALLAEQ